MNSLRNIIAIDRVSVSGLATVSRCSASSVKLANGTSWEEIPIQVPARLTMSDKIEDGVRQYTAQLVFKTCGDVGKRDRMVYRAKSADGYYFLIGTNDRPYPITTVNEPHPDNMNDSQLPEVTVTYTCSSMIPTII